MCMEKEGYPPPPTDERPATEMERVRELHIFLKNEAWKDLAQPTPLLTYPTNGDTSAAIAKNLLEERASKRRKTREEYAAALPPSRTGRVSDLYYKGSGLL